MKKIELFFVLALLTLSPFASADIPHLISLQGKLTDASDNPLSSSTNFAFRIYDVPTGGTALWTEFQTITPDTLGIFSALLGSVTALNIPFNESYWLEVKVNSEVLSPRQRMGSAGYALRSESPWNATGNDIYTTNAGNVGIGTSSPAQKLTVSGDVSWTGNLLGGSVPWARLSNIPNYAGSSSQGGPATTSSALAADGSNCGAGQYAQGVDASGNAQGCGASSTSVTLYSAPRSATCSCSGSGCWAWLPTGSYGTCGNTLTPINPAKKISLYKISGMSGRPGGLPADACFAKVKFADGSEQDIFSGETLQVSYPFMNVVDIRPYLTHASCNSCSCTISVEGFEY